MFLTVYITNLQVIQNSKREREKVIYNISKVNAKYLKPLAKNEFTISLPD